MSFKMLKHMGFFFKKICKNKIGQFKLELSKNVASKAVVMFSQFSEMRNLVAIFSDKDVRR